MDIDPVRNHTLNAEIGPSRADSSFQKDVAATFRKRAQDKRDKIKKGKLNVDIPQIKDQR